LLAAILNNDQQMNSAWKILQITLIFSIIYQSASSSPNLNKEKRALIKYIKSEYDSWNQNTVDPTFSDEPLNMDATASVHMFRTPGVIDLKAARNNSQKHEFQFEHSKFTFAEDQAVVEFVVDDQKFSAFFEKANSEWKFILAAKIG